METDLRSIKVYEASVPSTGGFQAMMFGTSLNDKVTHLPPHPPGTGRHTDQRLQTRRLLAALLDHCIPYAIQKPLLQGHEPLENIRRS